ncbi:MAG: type II CAAX endopeptidase family protein [Acidobacteriota bacterium]
MNRRESTLLFVFLTAIFSLPWWYMSRVHGGAVYVTLLMWSPALAAVITCKVSGKPLDELGWRGAEWRMLAGAWSVMFAAIVLVHFIVFALGLVQFPDPAGLAVRARSMALEGAPASLAVIAYIVSAVSTRLIGLAGPALGEEIGWRGFLVPSLCGSFGFARGSLLSGVIWAGWHFPLLIGRASFVQVLNFSLMVTGLAVAMAWFRLRSKSIWPSTVMHALHNALVPAFIALSARGEAADRWIDETGFALGAMGVMLAVVFLFLGTRRDPQRTL